MLQKLNVYIIGGGLPVDLAEVMPLQCIYCNVVISFLIYFFSIKWIIAN
jgi:hypothetical protein